MIPPASIVPWNPDIPTRSLIAVMSITPALSDVDTQIAPMAGLTSLVESRDSRMAWFKEARFGMFIHWGLYSAAGGYWPPDPESGTKYPQHYAEWIKAWAKVSEPEYGGALKPLFEPEAGCMDAWAELAQDAGMKYAVLTTKHHEGYTLFNSSSLWSRDNPVTGGTNISPAGRDLVDEYTRAFRKQGVKPGFYYSLIDWQHPGGEDYRKHMHQHLRELAENYGEIACLWVDFSSADTQGAHWGTREILEHWQQHQPKAIYNNRFWDKLENDYGDFFTPEKYVPPAGFPGRYFEVNHTLNESYGFSYHDGNWKTPREIIELLSDIASKGGNLLLNIGPDRYGHVPEPSVRALREVGGWLRSHGDAIYGTEASPFPRLAFEGRCTRSSKEGMERIFLHVFERPADGVIRLEGLKSEVASARLLGSPAIELAVERNGETRVLLPETPADSLMTVIEIELAGALEVDAYPHPRQSPDRVLELRAADGRIASSAAAPKLRREGDHFGWWSKVEDRVEFTFRIDQAHKIIHSGRKVERLPGRFRVVLDAACDPAGGGELEIRMADQITLTTIRSTGGWNDFREIEAGEVVFDQAGEFELVIQPRSIHGQGLVNLRGVRLVPLP